MDNAEDVRHFIVSLASLSNMIIVQGPTIHDFRQDDPSVHGLSAYAIIAESHIAVDAWPERGRTPKEGWMTLDLVSCKNFDSELVRQYTMMSFGMESVTFEDLHPTRGTPPPVKSAVAEEAKMNKMQALQVYAMTWHILASLSFTAVVNTVPPTGGPLKHIGK